jgi:hypothetical protein
MEVCLNIAIGFVVSLLFWSFVVVPVWNLPVSMHENVQITLAFTVLAVARGYIVRRFFNAELHRAAHRIAVAVVKWRRKEPETPPCYGEFPGLYSHRSAENDCLNCPHDLGCMDESGRRHP